MAARGAPVLIYAIAVAVCRLRRPLDLTLRSSGSFGRVGAGVKYNAESANKGRARGKPGGYVRRREEFRGNNGSAVRLVPSTPRGIYPGVRTRMERADVEERERNCELWRALPHSPIERLFHGYSTNNRVTLIF